MTTYEDAEQDYMRHKSQVALRLLKGGSNEPPDTDWLSKLPIGSVVLVNYHEGFGSAILQKYQVTNKSKYAVELWDTEKDMRLWVVPTLFCKEFRHFETLREVVEEQEVDG
jgi:hypothetical protein